MDNYAIAAILISLAALFSFVNYKWLRLPSTIGVMLIALIVSAGLLILSNFWSGIDTIAKSLMLSIDFDETLMQGMLSFLLFAGAMHINLDDLFEQRFIVLALATIGVLISTFLFGTAIYYALMLIGLEMGYVFCLLFGALISPTDPIAVLGILKSVGAPKSLETKIAGESLFNDGVGVVVFIVILEIAFHGEPVSAGHIAELFLVEAVGGAAFGLAAGWCAYLLLKRVDDYAVEALITLALVIGGYTLAYKLHLSGPIAIVVAGLLIGNKGRRFAMTEITRRNLDTFWELVDEILNTVLFVLIGMEIIVLTISLPAFLAGIISIGAVLGSRFISVGVPVSVMKFWRGFTPGVVRILVWGGLKGGISVALALSLPQSPERDTILTATYIVVIFSILVQGLTIKPFVRRILKNEK